MTKVEKDYRQHLGKLVYQTPKYDHLRKHTEEFEQLLFIESMERLGGWWHYRMSPIGAANKVYHSTVLCKELHFSLTGQEYSQNHARYKYRLANEESNEEAKQ